VGLVPKRLPFTTSNTIVRTFRHALSLDERRAKFKANLWNRPNKKEQVLSITDKAHKKPQKKKLSTHETLHAMEAKYSKDRNQPTDIDEVWFAGCHCDVGGGSVDNDDTINLARIPLRWMIRETFKTKSGIMFETDGLRSIGLDPNSLYPDVAPRPPALPVGSARIRRIPPKPSKPIITDPAPEHPIVDLHAELIPHRTEEELELQEALSPIYDQLDLAWFWWILEVIPMKHRHQRPDDSWMSHIGWNLGRGRIIGKHTKVRVHRSVKMRLEALHENGKRYKPKAKLDLDQVDWVA